MQMLKKFSYFSTILMLWAFIGGEPQCFAVDVDPRQPLIINGDVGLESELEQEGLIAQFKACYGKSMIHLPVILLTAGAFSAGFYLLFNNCDPQVMHEFLANTFFNDSRIGMEPFYNQFDTSLPYSTCFNSCTLLPLEFIPNADFAGDPYHGPGYMTWVPDSTPGDYDGVFNKGNISDMVTKIMELCGCTNLAYWESVVASILEGAKFDPAIINCTDNLDNATMCCGSGWSNDTWPDWRPALPDSTLNFRMVSGSGICAQAQAVQAWAANLKLFSLASLIPTGATALALWSRLKCMFPTPESPCTN